jgi:hypothetical protein
MTEVNIGSKAQVFHGTAKRTSGGLKKADLMKTKAGRIVSRKKHALGKKAIQRLFKAGYKPKKGSFKVMKKGMRSTRRSRGGGQMDSLQQNQQMMPQMNQQQNQQMNQQMNQPQNQQMNQQQNQQMNQQQNQQMNQQQNQQQTMKQQMMPRENQQQQM